MARKYGGKSYDAEQLAAIVFRHLREQVAKTTVGMVHDVVVTVPADWDIDACRATEAAARTAGFENVMLVDEPTAAFMYYQKQQSDSSNKPETVLIVDSGGGTLDVAIVRTMDVLSEQQGHYSQVKPLALAGTKLGGDDIDKIIAKEFIDDFSQKHQLHIKDKFVKSRIMEMAEETKIRLSNSFQQIGHDAEETMRPHFVMGDKSHEYTLTSSRFLELCNRFTIR